jgi:hypothetical protein
MGPRTIGSGRDGYELTLPSLSLLFIAQHVATCVAMINDFPCSVWPWMRNDLLDCGIAT